MRRLCTALRLDTAPLFFVSSSRCCNSVFALSHTRVTLATSNVTSKRPSATATVGTVGAADDLLKRLLRKSAKRPASVFEASAAAVGASSTASSSSSPPPRTGATSFDPVTPETLLEDETTYASSDSCSGGGVIADEELAPPETLMSEEAFYGSHNDNLASLVAAAAAGDVDVLAGSMDGGASASPADELADNQKFLEEELIAEASASTTTSSRNSDSDATECVNDSGDADGITDDDNDFESLASTDGSAVAASAVAQEEVEAQDELSEVITEQLLEDVASSASKGAPLPGEFTFFNTAEVSAAVREAKKQQQQEEQQRKSMATTESRAQGLFDDGIAVSAEMECVGDVLPSPER